ncbi:hypothetical protein D3C85_1302660 [compost metagenome]
MSLNILLADVANLTPYSVTVVPDTTPVKPVYCPVIDPFSTQFPLTKEYFEIPSEVAVLTTYKTSYPGIAGSISAKKNSLADGAVVGIPGNPATD